MPILNFKSVEINEEMLKLILAHCDKNEVIHMQNLVNDLIEITYHHWLADCGLRIAIKDTKDSKEYMQLFHKYFEKYEKAN